MYSKSHNPDFYSLNLTVQIITFQNNQAELNNGHKTGGKEITDSTNMIHYVRFVRNQRWGPDEMEGFHDDAESDGCLDDILF